MTEPNRAAVEQIFVGLIQAVSANNSLLTSLIAEIKGLREDIKGNEGLQPDIRALIDNTANLGEDVEELGGSMNLGFELLRRAADVGKKGRVTWSDLLDIMTQIELEGQEEEGAEAVEPGPGER